ncbi:MAG: hypothetical protein KJP07_12265, partial [Desulfatitalea sp.]|nr:hypothetical protein [Desulfatitalea sp.]
MGQEKTAQTKQPKGIRLPIVRTAADIDKLPHLSDEEKALAKANLKKVAPSDGWYLLGNNPELQWFWQLIELALVHRLAPDAQ